MGVDRWRAFGWVAYYRGAAGQWAWVLHRLTGLAVAAFLLIHIIDTFVFGFGPGAYNTLLSVWAQPIFLVLQVPLWGAVVYHALNGTRVIIIDFWSPGSLVQERLFWAVVVLSILLFLPGAFVMLSPIFR